MGSVALSSVFSSCGFVPESPCTVTKHSASTSSQLAAEGRDIAESEAIERRKQQQRIERKWLFCLNEDEELVDPPRGEILVPGSQPGPRHEQQGRNGMVTSAASSRQSEAFLKMEPLMKELFELHDLNKNGVLEEDELIKLNEKIAMLHYGKDMDRSAVKQKYKDLFRSKLDPNGKPVAFEPFRIYMLEVLDGMDRDRLAQELILEQFIAEAQSGRVLFHCPSFQSVTDLPYRSKIEERPQPYSPHRNEGA